MITYHSLLTAFIIVHLSSFAQAKTLLVTFGADGDQAASYGGITVAPVPTQDNSSEPAPIITVTGLDVDGIGGNDDSVEIAFSITNSTEVANLLNVGYRYIENDILTFNITSATLILGNGANTHQIDTIGFTSVDNHLAATTATVTSTDAGFNTLTGVSGTINLTNDLPGVSNVSLLNTSATSGRARNIVVAFDIKISVAEAPVASDDAYETALDTPLTAAVPGVLSNDTDGNGDALSVTLLTSPSNGSLTAFSADGSFTYQPSPGFSGTDTFTYEASDGGLSSNAATVSIVVSPFTYPKLILPSMLGSNRVIQRNQLIPIWGWGPAGQTVTVTLGSGPTTNSTVITPEGTWEITLPAMQATATPFSITASTNGSSVVTTNLLVGDVWLASGQSNAGWRLQFTDGGPEEAAIANHPLYRHFYTSKHPTDTPLDNIVKETDGDAGIIGISAEWTVCDPATAKYYSAIAYYFARDLQRDLNIPIGMIQASYAGTAAESWSKSVLPYALNADDLFIPAHQLYNGMINPHLKTPISGAIWIQGENNRWDGFNYAEKLTQMVTEWRSLWGSGDFPFYYVQIPPKFDYEDDPMYPLFLEGQTEVENTLSNSRMVVISDTTDGSGYHPKKKAPVGARLAVCALKNTYGQTSLVDSGPRLTSAVTEGSSFRLSFSDLGGGLAINPNIGYNANGDFQTDVDEDINRNLILDAGEDVDEDGKLDTGEDLNNNGVLDPGEDLDGDGVLDYSELEINMPDLTWFEICGTDGVFVPASAVIDGDTIVVSAPTVPNPIGVRYAWSKSAIGNLMNTNGLPAGSFRLVPPLAVAESYGLHENTELYVEPNGILANDLLGSSHLPLQRPTLQTTVTHGTLMLREDGAFIYEPATGFIGTDRFTYTVSDGTETSPETTVSINVLSSTVGTGQINRDVWTGISGFKVSDFTSSPDYPNNPNVKSVINSLDAPQNWDDDYGQRIYGYLHPPTNGDYTFSISSSARSELWISTDDSPANLVKIVSSLDRTVGDWTTATTTVTLVGGQRYYIEVLHKESGGADHMQVAWDLAGPGNIDIIEGTYLSGIPTPAPVTNNYTSWSNWYGVSGNDFELDYAFNLDPTQNNNSSQIMTPVTGSSGLPYWALLNTDTLVVEYLRRKNEPATTYTVQFSDDLNIWTDSDTVETVSPINATWERVIVEDDANMSTATKRFGRLLIIPN